MAALDVSAPRGVRILNPLGDGPGWTSRKRARRYVQRGHAHMVDGCLEFVRDPRNAGGLRHGPRFTVTADQQRAIDFRNFVGFLPPHVYGWPVFARGAEL